MNTGTTYINQLIMLV